MATGLPCLLAVVISKENSTNNSQFSHVRELSVEIYIEFGFRDKEENLAFSLTGQWWLFL